MANRNVSFSTKTKEERILQNKTCRSLNNWDGKPSITHRIFLTWLLQIFICSMLNLNGKHNYLCTVSQKLPYNLVPLKTCFLNQARTFAIPNTKMYHDSSHDMRTNTVIQVKFILSRQHSEKHNAFLAKCWLSAKLFIWPVAILSLLGFQVNRFIQIIFFKFSYQMLQGWCVKYS